MIPGITVIFVEDCIVSKGPSISMNIDGIKARSIAQNNLDHLGGS